MANQEPERLFQPGDSETGDDELIRGGEDAGDLADDADDEFDDSDDLDDDDEEEEETAI